MKRLIAAAVLFVLVTAIYFTGYLFINSTCKKTDTLLKECVTSYKNGENVNLYTTKLENFWESREKLLSVFMNHNDIDEIELAIESLTVHSKYKENEMFYEYSATIDMLLHQIMEDTAFGVHSIL